MAGVKFSAFTTGATTANTLIVGYDSVAGTNNQYTLAQLATGLATHIPTIYTVDGTMPADATRTVTANGTSNFIFTGGTNNNIQIGNLTGVSGMGFKIKPATGNATGTKVYITDTNDVNIIAKHSDIYNNGGNKSRVISIGRGNSDSVGGDRVAINHPFDFANNLGGLTGGAASAGSSLYIHTGNLSGGGVGNDCAIRAYGFSNFSTSPGTEVNIFGSGSTASDKYLIELNNWSGTYANPLTRKLFRVANSGRVEVGVPGQYQDQFTFASSTWDGSVAIPEPVLKVNGQAYSVFHQPTTPIANLTIDWNNSNIQEVTLPAGATTFTASNPKVGATYILTIKQTGAATATWTGVKWPAATAPTLSGTGKTDVITLICYDETGAGLYYGASTLNFTT